MTAEEQGRWHLAWPDDSPVFCCCTDDLHPIDPATILTPEGLNQLEQDKADLEARLRVAEGGLREILRHVHEEPSSADSIVAIAAAALQGDRA